MSTTTATKTPGRVCLTKCPRWCKEDHPVTDRTRHHRSHGTRPCHGLYASVHWTQTIDLPLLSYGPNIYLEVGDSNALLDVYSARGMVDVLGELGGEDNARAAALLREMVAMVDGGVSR